MSDCGNEARQQVSRFCKTNYVLINSLYPEINQKPTDVATLINVISGIRFSSFATFQLYRI